MRPGVACIRVMAVWGMVAATAGASRVATDPLRLDPGEAKSEKAYQAWAKDPRTAPRHPADCLRFIVHSSAKLRQDTYAFAFRQAGLAGESVRITRQLAELVNERAPLMTQPPATREAQKLDADLARRMVWAGTEFFKNLDRAGQLRLYSVAEKFEAARLAQLDLVRMGATVISDAWVAQARREDERGQGYLWGICQGADAEKVKAVEADFKLTVTFMLTFAGPPPYIHGDTAKNKVRAAKRAQRARILRELTPITF